uniref:Uncharacterized protein n=1 Tax=Monopterus albus TaxID=43700 RepID=A0A3Q3KDB2_MONAL
VKMTVLLLGSTVALLLLSAVASPVRNTSPSYDNNLNLNHIIDLVGEYNGSLRRVSITIFLLVKLFLQQFLGLVCSPLFFFLFQAKCPDLLKDVELTDFYELTFLFKHLTTCIQKRNFSMEAGVLTPVFFLSSVQTCCPDM